MNRRTKLAVLLAVLSLSAGCAPAMGRSPALAQAERALGTDEAKGDKALAPRAHARAQEALAEGQRADTAGDGTAAELHAERALGHLAEAAAIARSARASTDLARLGTDLTRLEDEAERAKVARTELEREIGTLDLKLRIAKELALPSPSAAASKERDDARRKAIAALATEARLLCGAARLLGASAQTVDPLEADATALPSKLASAGDKAALGPAIDQVTRLRAQCEAALTGARRSGAEAADTDMSQLSSAGFSPSRDERGVVVTLRPAWREAALSEADQKKLAMLGQIAKTSSVPVQVVVHESRNGAPSPRAEQRGASVAKALTQGGLDASRVGTLSAGGNAPLVDSSDARLAARNERVDIVFVR
jgi:hypothetical protein